LNDEAKLGNKASKPRICSPAPSESRRRAAPGERSYPVSDATETIPRQKNPPLKWGAAAEWERKCSTTRRR